MKTLLTSHLVAFFIINTVQRFSYFFISVDNLLITITHHHCVTQGKTRNFSTTTRTVDIHHHVQVKIQEGIKRQELCYRIVRSVEASNEIVFQYTKSKFTVHNRYTQNNYYSHEACDEFESSLYKLHGTQLCKGLDYEEDNISYVDKEQTKEENSKSFVVCGIYLKTECWISNFIKFLSDFHGQSREPHWEYHEKLW